MIKYLEYEEKRVEVLRSLNKTGFYLKLQNLQFSESQALGLMQNNVSSQVDGQEHAQLLEYTQMQVKEEKCNLANLKDCSTFIVCSWKS